MSNLTPRIDRIERSAFGSEIEVGKIPAPFTTIVNEQGQPRQISDLANNMKVSMGVERVNIAPIKVIDNEFGPNGEVVKAPGNGDCRVRFVGSNWYTQGHLTYPKKIVTEGSNAVGNFVEITFYGTGLNILSTYTLNAVWNTSVDGGVEFDISPISSSIIADRQYTPNQIIPVVKGLSLGIHTVKITLGSSANPWLIVDGFEILNETSLITVNPGKPRFNSKTQELSSQVLTNYNSDFDALSDTLGTKGGRVLVYQAADGSINKRLKTIPNIGDGIELITNGDFGTGDLTGWDTTSGPTYLNGGLNMPSSSVGTYQEFSTVIGKKYRVEFNVRDITNNGIFFDIRNSSNLTISQGVPVISVKNNFAIYFTATDTTHRLSFSGQDVSSGGTIDNVSVKEADYGILSSTDHSNEEIIRKINFREFGANRADDFSTLSATSDRGFTLEDGTTSLIGNDISAQSPGGGAVEGVVLANGGYLTITFVGTGLDLLIGTSAAYTNVDPHQFFVDNVSLGVISGNGFVFSNGNLYKAYKVCSGLPYGTHTVKIQRNAGVAAGLWIKDFLIYQPKAPSIPSDALEICDYNVMADYSSVITEMAPSPGAIFKAPSREFVYTGTWEAYELSVTEFATPILIRNLTGTGETFEYTFFGTGIELFGRGGSAAPSITLQIDGVNYTGSADVSAGSVWTPGSSTWQPSTGFGERINISGLSLGVHTIKGTVTANPGQFAFTGCAIITPIHINDSSLKVGSLGLKDLRKAVDVSNENKNKIDLSKAKAWLIYDTYTNTIRSSYNISSVIQWSTGRIIAYFKQPFIDNNYVVVYGKTLSGEIGRDGSKGNTESYTSMVSLNSTNTAIDNSSDMSMVVFGTLKNEENIDLEDL